MPRLFAFLLLVTGLTLTGCDSADPLGGGSGDSLTVETATDISADPTTGRDPETGDPISSGRYTLYSLRDGGVVLSDAEEDRSDSTSTAWDIGFNGTDIVANITDDSEGGIQLVTGAFEEVVEAPAAGYEATLAAGSGNSWYTYNPSNNTVTPTAGRVIVVRNADGSYSKVRILSYYRGNPEDIDPMVDESRYYTFEYVTQPDGSRDFSEE